jgi:ABC-2 type transport system ATP-binding protein
MKAEDQLKFYCEFYGYSSSESRQRSKELLELVGLSAHRSRKIKTFSHGMRKRLALAQAMVNDPDLLILDEPMGGLDPMGLHSFREMIKELNRNNITIFLSSHLLAEVQLLCNRVGIINHGKILAVDSINNLSRDIELDTLSRLSIAGDGFTEKILEYVRSVPGVKDIKRSEDGEDEFIILIHEDTDARKLALELNRGLAAKNIYLSRIEQAKPTLEELFMKITRGT